MPKNNESVKKLLRFQKELEELKEQRAENEGALKQSLETLKKDYKCSTIEKAQELLTALTEELSEMEELLDDTLAEIERKYGEQLSNA